MIPVNRRKIIVNKIFTSTFVFLNTKQAGGGADFAPSWFS